MTGTLEADVHVTGSGEDPHLQGFVDIKNGAFGVPRGGGTYTGLTTRIELEPDAVQIQRVRDPRRARRAAARSPASSPCTSGRSGAVNVSIDSDNFELIDNELGDVRCRAALKITGELRRPRLEGDVRVDAARIEVDEVLQLFYDPYAVEALPEVVSAERTVEGSGSAEEATRQALAKAEQSAAAPGAASTRQTRRAAGAGRRSTDPVALDVHARASPTTSCSAARTSGRAGRPARRSAT